MLEYVTLLPRAASIPAFIQWLLSDAPGSGSFLWCEEGGKETRGSNRGVVGSAPQDCICGVLISSRNPAKEGSV